MGETQVVYRRLDPKAHVAKKTVKGQLKTEYSRVLPYVTI